MILVGVGIASGEYILFPYIASQVGLVFLWAAIVGLLTQYFINMEVERYTLATGETAITGFQRLWKPFGLVMVACAIVPNIWPGWATSAATITTFLFGGGNPNAIAIGALVADRHRARPPRRSSTRRSRSSSSSRSRSVLVFLVVAARAAISAERVGDARPDRHELRHLPGGELELAVLLGALAYAGAGGTNNLVVSNWIRDKGYGMGPYAPRVVSPITGEEEAAPIGPRLRRSGSTDENLERWRDWWRKANIEQFVLFFVIGAITIVVFSLVAYSTVYGNPAVKDSDFDFIQIEGNALKDMVGTWFGTLFWVIGAVSLFGAALGIIDYVSRLVADVLRVGYLRDVRALDREPAVLRRGLDADRCAASAILLSGFDQPLSLVVIAAALERRRHVHLLDPADGHQPALPAGAAEDPRHPARRAAVGRRAVRRDVDPRGDQRGERLRGNSGSSRISSKSGSRDAHSSTSGASAAAACRCLRASSRRPATAS